MFGYQPSCKEIAQEICFNTPEVEPVDVPANLVFPEPLRRCQNLPISLPRIVCKVESEEICFKIPTLEDHPMSVEKCHPVISNPKCQKIELVLPKQICQDIIYGFTHATRDYQELD